MCFQLVNEFNLHLKFNVVFKNQDISTYNYNDLIIMSVLTLTFQSHVLLHLVNLIVDPGSIIMILDFNCLLRQWDWFFL